MLEAERAKLEHQIVPEMLIGDRWAAGVVVLEV
jgi:hypothetical protein